MAEEQDQIDNDDVDETAVKAAEIGKAIGVEDNKTLKDDVPDYEIEEESDERIAKEREPRAGVEGRKKLSTKEKRDARKRAVDRRLNEKDSVIEQQQQQLQELAAWKNQVEGRLTNVDKGKVDDAMANLGAAYNKAKADYTSAFTEGDGEKAAAAMTAMYEHQRKFEDLQKLKQQYERAPAAPQNTMPNPKVISKAKAWAAKHDWYDASGTDEDSEIAKSLSQVLANEGLDPATDKFWTELDKRLVKRGVIDATDAEDADEDDYEDEEPVAKKPKKRGSPPVSGGSNRGGDAGGKMKISLPTRYVNTLKENGIWDDVPRRNRVIQGYLKARREAQANG